MRRGENITRVPRGASAARAHATWENRAGVGVRGGGPIYQSWILRKIEVIRDVSVSRSHTQTRRCRIQVQSAAAEHKCADRRLFKNNSAAGAQHSLARAKNVPRHSQPR